MSVGRRVNLSRGWYVDEGLRVWGGGLRANDRALLCEGCELVRQVDRYREVSSLTGDLPRSSLLTLGRCGGGH